MSAPVLSIVLATHQRREVVLNTIRRLREPQRVPVPHEIIVVDNASRDGTREALRSEGLRVCALAANQGACAREHGLRAARAPFILMLDDDSYPRAGSVERLLAHFQADPKLGAASFMVHLPDGSSECSALPHVFIGCGVGLRTAALRRVGGLDVSFFMAAEEYDLSFRLLGGGWRVESFPDLHVEHLKSPAARQSARTARYDVRNNLRVIARYLPGEQARVYREDWLARYRWLARLNGHEEANARGERAGRRWAALERLTWWRRRLPESALERIFRWREIERRMSALAASGVRELVLADWGKNVYAFVRGAQRAGLRVRAIADDRFARVAAQYRGIPLIPVAEALDLPVHTWVVSNTSFVHADRARERLTPRTPLPIVSWFGAASLARLPADHESVCFPNRPVT